MKARICGTSVGIAERIVVAIHFILGPDASEKGRLV
jgi:hypothetical protein